MQDAIKAIDSEISISPHSRIAKRFDSIHALNTFIETWFETCDELGKIPTLANLAVAMRCSREDILEYQGDKDVMAALGYARTRIAAAYESAMVEAPGMHHAEMFLLKTNHGYTERTLIDKRSSGETRTIVKFELPTRTPESALCASVVLDAIESGESE